METYQKIERIVAHSKGLLVCVGCFLLILLLLILIIKSIPFQSSTSLFFGICLFFGWIIWTFFEYILHRFIWHGKKPDGRRPQSDPFNHLYHHKHPGEIRVSKTNRIIILSGTAILLYISIRLHDYFTIFTGFVIGFASYTFMHYLLHQKITQKVLARHVRYHICHHCKYPDKCFGITVTWWDDLFGTYPPKKGAISQKVIDFYFGNKKD